MEIKRILGIITALIVMLPVSGLVFAADAANQPIFNPVGWSGRTMMSGWDIISGWSAIDWFWMLAWYLIAIIIISLAVRWLVRVRHAPYRSSMEIIKERYAKGELTKEHFEEMKKELLK